MSDEARPGDPKLPRPESARGLATAGGVASAVWMFGIVVYVLVQWDAMADLSPNSLGDFLAGVFAPLAFLWLVLGFSQQGVELRNNGKALLIQGEELRASVEQQRQLVEVTREQLVFESTRITAEQERDRKLAQPRFELQTGGSVGLGSQKPGRAQTFYLVNHGRGCTRLRLKWDTRRLKEFDQLAEGKRVEFVKPVYEDFEDAILTVAYLDGRGEEGNKSFALSMNDRKVIEVFDI